MKQIKRQVADNQNQPHKKSRLNPMSEGAPRSSPGCHGNDDVRAKIRSDHRLRAQLGDDICHLGSHRCDDTS